MYLIYMRPEQIKKAAAADLPLLMAAGVMEYHGPHLPVGTDYLIAAKTAKTRIFWKFVAAFSTKHSTCLHTRVYLDPTVSAFIRIAGRTPL